MTTQLCVLLWARPGATEALTAYEDAVLALLGDHGGRVLQRARVHIDGAVDAPTEIQIIEFASQDGYAGFVTDDRRGALAHQRDAAVARTVVYPVDLA